MVSRDGDVTLRGIFEIDEVYSGDKQRNKHESGNPSLLDELWARRRLAVRRSVEATSQRRWFR